MEDFLLSVLGHEPGHKSEVYFAPAHLMLALQYKGTEAVMNAALGRLETDTDSSLVETMAILLNLCISDPTLSPDAVDVAIERILEYALKHPSYIEGLQWVCAFLHYQSKDELAVGQMAESGAIEVARTLLNDSKENALSVAAACAVLSHFNCYEVGNAVESITAALIKHATHKLAAKLAVRAIAEFTSFWGGSTEQPVKFGTQFLAQEGLDALLTAMRNFGDDEPLQLSCCRVLSNLGSGDGGIALGAKNCVGPLAQACLTYLQDEMIVSHSLHAIANIPIHQEHYDKSIVEATIAALKAYEASELIQTEAIRVCGTLATLIKESKAHMAEKGLIPLIITGLKAHPNAVMFHQEVCNVFSYLAFDSENITQSITSKGGIQMVIQAMTRFADNESLQTTACAALSGLTFNNTPGQNIVLTNKGVTVVLDALRRGSRERLHEMGCLAIGTMCWNVELKSEVVNQKGIDVILASMEKFSDSPSVVKNAARALAQIAFNSESYREEMSNKKAIPKIIQVMLQHEQHDRVQMHGCVALSYLSWTNESNATEIASNNGYRVIVSAMKNHPTNPEVQEHACRALANISSVMIDGADEAIEMMMAAMKRHDRVPEVQEEACRAIVTLSLVTSNNKDKLFTHHASERVVAALKAYPRSQVVQQEACNALAHLAYEHAALNKEVTELGGVELLLNAMKSFPNVVKVQLNACGGLSALAFDNPIAQRQIFDGDGVDVVITAMRTWDKLRILELGCSVLGTLAWNPEIKEQVAVIAIPEILRAMRVHADNALLQKSTCRAISQFAFNSEANRQRLYEAKAIPHIVAAMKAHLDTEKLVSHAIVALTYLCWENSDVAKSIIDEGTIDLLHKVEVNYARKEKIANKAVHLLKILGRKSTPQSSPHMHSPKLKDSAMSPPPDSPAPMGRKQTSITPAQPPSPSPMQTDADDNAFFAYRKEAAQQRPERVTSRQMEDLEQRDSRDDGQRGGRGRGRGGRGRGNNGSNNQRGGFSNNRDNNSNQPERVLREGDGGYISQHNRRRDFERDDRQAPRNDRNQDRYDRDDTGYRGRGGRGGGGGDYERRDRYDRDDRGRQDRYQDPNSAPRPQQRDRYERYDDRRDDQVPREGGSNSNRGGGGVHRRGGRGRGGNNAPRARD